MNNSTPNHPAQYSRFYQRIARRYSAEIDLLPPAILPQYDDMQALFTAIYAQHPDDLGSALRITRNVVMQRLIELDCAQPDYSVEDVTLGYTDLAAFCTQTALSHAYEQLIERHGRPMQADGQPACFWVMGMGKLGARELNASSDIDLICLHSARGETEHTNDTTDTGRRIKTISNTEFFSKLVRQMSTLIADVTEHGFCFRVDLALRPHGKSGPASMSLAALEKYLLKDGREWERFAWLKSRVIASTVPLSNTHGAQLRNIVLPFVFRSQLDYKVFESLRSLHQKIRKQADKVSAHLNPRQHDVKLGRGGIREIEFTVQLLQVVRGGQFPELRHRSTLKALVALAAAGLMDADIAQQLADAYCFLRRVEHRIQYLDDQQTHTLPTSEADVDWIAHSLGFDDTSSFYDTLAQHCNTVMAEFDVLLGGANPESNEVENNDWDSIIEDFEGTNAIANTPHSPLSAEEQTATEELLQYIQRWRTGKALEKFGDSTQERVKQLVEQALHKLQQRTTDALAVRRFIDWMETILRYEHYLALLLERPNVLDRLLNILGAALWPTKYLMRHPGVIDELASPDLLQERFDPQRLRDSLRTRYDVFAKTGENTEETLLDVLRRAYHAETFAILARDLEGRTSVEEVSDDLSLLADIIAETTLHWAWQFVSKRHRDTPQVAIIAYGKSGGKELGYGSDLDVVFAYEDDDPAAPEAYAALVRKFITWMTVKTGEGELIEVDTALRPNGNSGLLITSFDSYANYQQQRGSNTAWTWEHQAMTRARCMMGSDAMHQHFERIREQVLTAERDIDSLRHEITDMRRRMHEANRPPTGQFDIKHSHGGMIDVEFVVQFFVLAYSKQHPELIENKGNIALLERIERAGLLPTHCGVKAGNAYRELRRLQHRARLDDQAGRIPPDTVQAESHAIQQLWQYAGLAAYANV